jgi:hypothetical protein
MRMWAGTEWWIGEYLAFSTQKKQSRQLRQYQETQSASHHSVIATFASCICRVIPHEKELFMRSHVRLNARDWAQKAEATFGHV